MLPLKDNVPTRTFPYVTVGLIAANVLVYLWEISSPGLEAHVYAWGYYPCAVQGPCLGPAAERHGLVATVFSSMFMHGGLVHIAGNMLFLWIFGNNVEDAMGRLRFVLFYFLGGIAATTLQTLVTFHWGSPGDTTVPSLGASGAISAVLGAYLLLLPTASVLTFVFFLLIEIPAILFLGIWFLFQLWQGGYAVTHPESGGGVAFFAHVGGFAFGLLTVRAFAVRDPLPPRAR